MDEVWSALIGVGGVIIGVSASLLTQLILSKVNNKKVMTHVTIVKRIESYESAIKYVLQLCYIAPLKKTNLSEFIRLTKENDDFYRSFYYTFSFFISCEEEKRFNEIRNLAMSGGISTEEAYEQLTSFLHMKLLNDKNCYMTKILINS